MPVKQYTAVIIEDIAVARVALKRDLELHCPEIKVLGSAEGVISGAKIIQKLQPDILFLDIELVDGSGFDLLDILPELKAKVIFTTASEHYAVKAFRFAAVDYLLKPIQIDQLKESIIKAIDQGNDQQAAQFEVMREELDDNRNSEKIALHTQEKIMIVHLQEILYCQSNSNYTNFKFTDGKSLLVTKTLKEFELLLKDKGFLRIHQSFLVNTRHIKSFIRQDGGHLVISQDIRLPVSFRKRAEVIRVLDQLS